MTNLSPSVKSIIINQEEYIFKTPISYYFLADKVNVFTSFIYKIVESPNEDSADIIFSYDDLLKEEAYKISITDKVYIKYKSSSGAYYALNTLSHYIKDNKIKKLEIYDEPKLKVRGLMLDISRNKVIKVNEIKRIIDLMSKLKMNHLELYVEGFSFGYNSFKKYLIDEGYISLDEYLDIESYALDRFIDLVPNLNGFGHMTDFLEKDEFKDLAICPDGVFLWGRNRKPSTINPLDERSLELVKNMYKDLLPYTKSKYFNMNFDEPFELGLGKTNGLNKEDLFIDYTLKAYSEVKKYNKTPLMWGDVLVRHDDKWDALPKDMIFVDWGYDANYPFKVHAKKLHAKNVSFITAPGTCSWSSFLGRYVDWFENIKNAIDASIENHGLGVLLTDWGDFGHLQFLPMSYAPLIFTGLYSWTGKDGEILKIANCLNEYIYQSENNEGIIGNIILDLNNYYRYENGYAGNGTKSFYRFMWGSVAKDDTKLNNMSIYDYYVSKVGMNALSFKKYMMLNDYFDFKLNELKYVNLTNDEVKLVCEELKQTISILKMINHFSIVFSDEITNEKKIELLNGILENKDEYLTNQRKLWLQRNKLGGLDTSLKHLTDFFYAVEDIKLFLVKRGK